MFAISLTVIMTDQLVNYPGLGMQLSTVTVTAVKASLQRKYQNTITSTIVSWLTIEIADSHPFRAYHVD